MENSFHLKRKLNLSLKSNLAEITLQGKIDPHLIQSTSKKAIRKSVMKAIKNPTGKGKDKNTNENLTTQTITDKKSPTKTIKKDPSTAQENNHMKAKTTSRRKMTGTRIEIISQLTKSRPTSKMKDILK